MIYTRCTGQDLPACDTCRRLIAPDDCTRYTVHLQPMVRDDECADYVQGAWPAVPPLGGDACAS